MKNNSLDNWYRGSFEQTPGDPPDFVWDSIAGELDAAASLPFAWRRVAISALLLLFTGAGIASYFIFAEDAKAVLPQVAHADPNHEFIMYDDAGSRVDIDQLTLSPISEVAELLMSAQEKLALSGGADVFSPAVLVPQPAHPTFSEPIIEDPNGEILIAEVAAQIEQAEQLRLEQQALRAELIFTPLPPSNKMNSLSASNYRFTGQYGSKVPASLGVSHILVDDETVPQGFFVGAAITVSEVWALNYETYDGWDKESLSVNNTKVGSDLSILAGLNISDTRGVQAELSLFKSRGQSNSTYVDGEYVTTDLHLLYSQINFLFKRRHSRYLFRDKVPTSISVLAGPYLAHLRGASATLNGQGSDVQNQYMNYDFGVDFGLEYDLHVLDKWAVSASVRGSAGLVNVFAGNSKIPRDFDRTRNLSLGAQIGVKYMLGK
jgi:hypothetical protein